MPAYSRPAALALLAAASLLTAPAGAMPTTFGTVIGNALLCRSHLENRYFHDYLTTSFGPAYKREGGAYWFRLEATLWGAEVKEVMVSDDTSELVFIAAVLEGKPEELETAIRGSAGIAFKPKDATPFPLRVSNSGSTIAYMNDKSKIYCAKFKSMPVR
ncbi:hypothetical protein LQ564_15335 [Massilia sp. G4R7]|uniref:Uncharacterized protein n=1 Tax=Massilia phyllostachyos TaxID=2898585 RepID=A0ABS8Q9G0_9BURK|nr:hypothetical protein [Massilia phyllostachyos]MCD2517687.1 hypothetical protein [Massilia phyllostachyos]